MTLLPVHMVQVFIVSLFCQNYKLHVNSQRTINNIILYNVLCENKNLTNFWNYYLVSKFTHNTDNFSVGKQIYVYYN